MCSTSQVIKLLHPILSPHALAALLYAVNWAEKQYEIKKLSYEVESDVSEEFSGLTSLWTWHQHSCYLRPNDGEMLLHEMLT